MYNRSAATHDVSVEEGKVKEKKGFLIGARDYFANKFLRKKTSHYGVDLACDAEFGGNDSRGKPVKKPDGDHGHLYIHYKAATATEPGSIMLGLEAAAPRSSKHSKVGASDPVSPTGCSKWNDLSKKKKYSDEPEYNATTIPQKYNGLHANLTKENMLEIVNQDTKSFGTDLATAIPQKSFESFRQMTAQHDTPELQAPKEQLTTVEKPSLWKRTAGKLTFGKAYKKERANYKQYVKDKKAYNKIVSGNERRNKSSSSHQSLFRSRSFVPPDTPPNDSRPKGIKQR